MKCRRFSESLVSLRFSKTIIREQHTRCSLSPASSSSRTEAARRHALERLGVRVDIRVARAAPPADWLRIHGGPGRVANLRSRCALGPRSAPPRHARSRTPHFSRWTAGLWTRKKAFESSKWQRPPEIADRTFGLRPGIIADGDPVRPDSARSLLPPSLLKKRGPGGEPGPK